MMPPQPLPSIGMEEAQTPGRLLGVFIINLRTELAFNVSENKSKPNVPSHLHFQHEDILLYVPTDGSTRTILDQEGSTWRSSTMADTAAGSLCLSDG